MGRMKKPSGHCCYYCQREMIESKPTLTAEMKNLVATIDHVIPRGAGGSDDPYNIVISCYRCNNLKSDLPAEAFRQFAKTVIQKFPNATTTVLRRSMTIYLMHLVESAMHKKSEVNRALSLSLLKMTDELENNCYLEPNGKSNRKK